MRPNRTTLLITAMAGLIVLLVIALVSVVTQSAKHEPSPRNDPAVAPATPPASENQIAAAPAAPAGDADDALSRWIAGGWAEAETNCETDTGAWYDPNGRYGASGAEGLWRIENGALVVTITHEAVGDPLAEEYVGLPNPETTRHPVTRESQDRMIQVVDGRPVRMMRCPSAHHSFAT